MCFFLLVADMCNYFIATPHVADVNDDESEEEERRRRSEPSSKRMHTSDKKKRQARVASSEDEDVGSDVDIDDRSRGGQVVGARGSSKASRARGGQRVTWDSDADDSERVSDGGEAKGKDGGDQAASMKRSRSGGEKEKDMLGAASTAPASAPVVVPVVEREISCQTSPRLLPTPVEPVSAHKETESLTEAPASSKHIPSRTPMKVWPYVLML